MFISKYFGWRAMALTLACVSGNAYGYGSATCFFRCLLTNKATNHMNFIPEISEHSKQAWFKTTGQNRSGKICESQFDSWQVDAPNVYIAHKDEKISRPGPGHTYDSAHSSHPRVRETNVCMTAEKLMSKNCNLLASCRGEKATYRCALITWRDRPQQRKDLAPYSYFCHISDAANQLSYVAYQPEVKGAKKARKNKSIWSLGEF